ncbi:MAG: hypothetical protein V3V84_00720 [Candidatus Bathyarchaeia archaeon]
MGILSFLGVTGGKAVGNAIAAPIKAFGDAVDKIFTSDEEILDKKITLEKIRINLSTLQAEITKQEASHPSIFIAGGRPSLLWICSISLGLYYIPQFIVAAFIWTKLCLVKNMILPYPMDAKQLIELVIVLVGAYGIRSFEKLKGIARNNMR